MKTTLMRGSALVAIAIILFGAPNRLAAQSTVSLSTDNMEYSPGTVATLMGSGFVSDENVTLQVKQADGTVIPDANGVQDPWTITADADGKFSTAWAVPVNVELQDPTLVATADGQSSSEHAETTFKGSQGGTGVVTVSANGGSCLDFTAAQGNGPDNWEVAEGGSYTVTISGVTECTGDAITVFVQNSDNGNWCFNATGGNGTYTGTITFPSPNCNTSPISYKCGADQDCSNANSYTANGPSGTGSVHFRASTFNADCVRTGDDTDCSAQTCTCTPATNITITAIENDQVQVCWDAQPCATGYILQYQWKGHQNWVTIDDVISPDHCATIDLKGHTNIYVRVATMCSTGDTTEFSYVANYRYTAPCIIPSNMSTTNITANSATLNWTPGTVTGIQRVRYQISTSTASTVISISADAKSLNIGGLNPSTQYKWKVKGDCWSPFLKFTTSAQKLGDLSSSSLNQLSVYPNPASDNLYVNIKMNDSQTHSAVIELTNMLGQIMYSQNTQIVNGETTLNIKLGSQMTDGVYMLRVVADNQSMEKRVVINSNK